MIKQIDRVIGDLQRQVDMFVKQGGNPICVGFIGINFSGQYTSYEGDRAFLTDGKKYKHPSQEAAEAESCLLAEARPSFDEFLIGSLWIPDWLGYFAQICLLSKPEGRRITYCCC